MPRDFGDAGLACSRSGAAAQGGQGGEPGALLGFDETEWRLDALAGQGLSAWLDPWRASRVEAGASTDEAETGSGARTPLDWVDRFARRASGVALHGAGSRGVGHG